MRQALGNTTAQLDAWEWHPLRHAVLHDRMVARVTGTAVIGGHSRLSWSSVVKLFRRTELGDRGEEASASREILAYGSGLLVGLPAPLRAPRLLGIDDNAAGVWLWLEDLQDAYRRDWPLEQFGLAARHLGVFNRAYLVARKLPTYPWLNPWLSRPQTEVRDGLHRVESTGNFSTWFVILRCATGG